MIKGLYEAGVASNGIVIMDVGINPSHPIHRAALGNADAISVVLKAELPDIAQGKDWLEGMIRNLAAKSNRKGCHGIYCDPRKDLLQHGF